MNAFLRYASIPGMLGLGAVSAIQAQITGRLASALGGGFQGGSIAALWGFASAFVVVTIVVFSSRRLRAGMSTMIDGFRSRRLPRTLFLGGLFGSLVVASQAFTVAAIGVALFTVAFVAGQTGSALVVDKMGLGPAGSQPMSKQRIVAVVITLIAVVVGASGRFGAGGLAGFGVALVLVAFLGGLSNSFQQALNGRVAALGSIWTATWNHFLVGTMVLAILVGLSRIGADPLPPLPAFGEFWWLYITGLLGVIFIWGNTSFVRVHGVLVLSLCVLAGQVTTAILIDFLSAEPHGDTATVVGAILTMVGVIIALAARRVPKGLDEQKAGPAGPATKAQRRRTRR